MATWTLHLGDRVVGKVVERSEDFPRLDGVFTAESFMHGPANAVERRLADFYRLNCECHRLLDLEDSLDVAKERSRNNEELEPFEDLIESADWTLRGPDRVIAILCPLFRPDGRITWSWRTPG
jgi:hypothetical protein